MCLRCQSSTFSFSEQSNSEISLINSGFNNYLFSKETNIFPDENQFNSIGTPFNDSDQPVPIDSKYYDINDFNKLNIYKNSSIAILHINIASLSKHFDDLQNFLSLLKHSFDIIGIWEHKTKKNSMNIDFTQLGYTFYFNETESSHGGTGFFISDN